MYMMVVTRHKFLTGPPYVRLMPNVSAVAGEPLYIPCPVAGYPIDSIIWDKGNNHFISRCK